jgi:low affinity Fe/Cu permease
MPDDKNKANVQKPGFPSFPTMTGSNDSDALKTYLNAVYDFSVRSTQINIDWYSAKAKPYSKYAQTTRFGAILFVALAGITPLFVGTGMLTASAQILTQISYIFIGIAALLVGMDKFFGFSSSWMRYITTQITLETLLAKFRFDWAVASVRAASKLDASACKPLLELAQKFAIDVQSKIENETAEWATELRNNISEIDKTTKEKWEAARQVNKPPVIESLEASEPSPQPAGTVIT